MMDIKKSYHQIFSFIFNDENRTAIYISISIFVLSFIIGLCRPEWFLDYQEKLIPTILNGSGLYFLDVFLTILWTNIKASALGLFLGIFLIPTIVLSLVNGYVFGAVTSKTFAALGIKQVVLSVAPHAIFEIPLIIMSYAYGLIIGISLIRKIKGEKVSIIDVYKRGVQLFVFVLLPLLVIAAAIESLLISHLQTLLRLHVEQILFSLIILYLFYLTARVLRNYLKNHDPKLIIMLTVVFIGTVVLWMAAYGLRVLELLEQSFFLKLFLVLIPLGVFLFYLYLENLRYQEEKAKKQIEGAFQQYVSPELIDEITRNPEKLKLGGEKKNLTIFFSDIRDFTSLSEKLRPQQLVHCVNEYFSAMSDIILDKKGVIDKYIGDAIMAFWNAPLDVVDHETLACASAVEMKKALQKIRKKWARRGIKQLNIGIGIHTGDVVVGNMGSSKRFDYTIMGDAVNLAARLESINKIYGTVIIISKSTYEKVKDKFVCHKLDFVKVKGKKEPIEIYHLIDTKQELTRSLQDFITAFESALEQYHKGKWNNALKGFRKCLKMKPDFKATKTFIQRCNKFKKSQPKSWDGAYKMTKK